MRMIGIVEFSFHALRVGHEVGGDVAAIELHALGELDLVLEPLGLFDGDDTVLADLVHDVGDQFADLMVRGRNRSDLGDIFLALDVDGESLEVLDNAASRACSIPCLISIGFAPAATLRRPS